MKLELPLSKPKFTSSTERTLFMLCLGRGPNKGWEGGSHVTLYFFLQNRGKSGEFDEYFGIFHDIFECYLSCLISVTLHRKLTN